jgi:hypothetical protein
MCSNVINNMPHDPGFDAGGNYTVGPMSGSPFVIPCEVSYEQGTYFPSRGPCEPFEQIAYADMYVYQGKMLTSASAFIKKGKPASAKDIENSHGKATLIIKGSSGWKKGKNKGAFTNDFQHFGLIESFKPDPVIE